MYLDHFKFKEYPFQLTTDTDFMYMSEAHVRAKSYMDYAIWNQDGFVVVTGAVGCGKTSLIQKLITELDDTISVAKVFQTQLDETEFLQAVLVEFGLNPFNAKKVELIDMLNQFLVDNYANEKQTLLIVDDAQILTMKVLEEIRMFSSIEAQKEKILHVILVGQPELNDTLESPQMEQLLQRIRLRYHIPPLSKNETKAYIQHRLGVAGVKNPKLFAAATMPIIYKYSGGVPRLINTLCDTALTCAFADGVKSVNVRLLNAAVDELQWKPYKDRYKEGKKKPDGRKTDYSHIEKAEGIEVLSDDINLLTSVIKDMSLKVCSIEEQLIRIANRIETKPKDK